MCREHAPVPFDILDIYSVSHAFKNDQMKTWHLTQEPSHSGFTLDFYRFNSCLSVQKTPGLCFTTAEICCAEECPGGILTPLSMLRSPLSLLGLLVIVDESLFPHILVHVVESFRSLVFSFKSFFLVDDLEFNILFYLSPTLEQVTFRMSPSYKLFL